MRHPETNSAPAAPRVRGRAPGRRPRASVVVTYAACGLIALILGLPFYWMISGALKSEAELHAFPPTFFPVHPTLENFRQLWVAFNFLTYFWNSTWLALVRAAIPTVTSALCGYVLAKIAFRGRGIVFVGLLVTMMLPGAITLIPSYILMFHLGWIGTYWPLIVPSAFSAFSTFLMRQMMATLPDDLLAAARIDGASEFAVFRQIALPAMLPGVAAVFILAFIAAWDDYVWPLMVLSDPSHFTLPIGLAGLVQQHTTYLGPLMAGSVVATIPVAIVFFVGQRWIVESGLFSGLRL